MRQETEGRRACFPFIRCLFRLGLRAAPLIVLAWTGIIAPAHAAEKAKTETAPTMAANNPANAGKMSAQKPPATATAAQRIELLDEATMKSLEKSGASSAEHRLLASLGGEWSFDLTYWQKKGAAPEKSTGTAMNEMILGDRFLSSKIQVLLNIGGQLIPYKGWNILGYDPVTKTYSSVLMDTMRAGMAIGTAQYDGKLKTLKESGHFTFPLIDKERTYRSEIQLIDGNSYKQTVFIPDSSGKEFKALELDFRRPR